MYTLAEKRIELDSSVQQLLCKCNNAIKKLHPDARVILYGSYARKGQTQYSDIDFLVLMQNNISERQRIQIHDLLYDITLAENVVISVIVKSVEKWNTPICQATGLYQEIQKEGIEII
jgi:predicted nucleotidyltransferase